MLSIIIYYMGMVGSSDTLNIKKLKTNIYLNINVNYMQEINWIVTQKYINPIRKRIGWCSTYLMRLTKLLISMSHFQIE